LDRFIDGACFLPNLAGILAMETISINHEMEEILLSHLNLAFAIYDCLPPYMLSMVAPKLALALGAVASYIGNNELAIRSYWEGVQSCHSQDLFTLGILRMQSGKLMTLLAENDPEHWVHVAPSGRSLLRGAASLFIDAKLISGALLNILQSNLWLLRSYVAQARAQKLVLDRERHAAGGLAGLELTDVIAKVNRIGDVLELAKTTMWQFEAIV